MSWADRFFKAAQICPDTIALCSLLFPIKRNQTYCLLIPYLQVDPNESVPASIRTGKQKFCPPEICHWKRNRQMMVVVDHSNRSLLSTEGLREKGNQREEKKRDKNQHHVG